MIAHGRYQALIGHSFILMLAVFVAGCGGGGGDGGATPSPTVPTVSTEDIFPDSGLVVAVEVGQVAFLNGSGSTTSAEGELAYSWSFTHKPDGSNAVLQDTTTVAPSFLADVRGTYMVQLVVSVDGVASEPVIGSVEAINDYSLDIPRPDHTKNTGIKFRSQCLDCHIGGPGEVIGKSSDHIETSDLCQACHSILTFAPAPFVDHEQIADIEICTNCHNGVLAIGKSDLHVATTEDCKNCHTTISFPILEADGSYNHTEISSDCTRCHNAIIAIGIDDDHINTAKDCIFCHTTDEFKPATFYHNADTSNCRDSGCHTGLPGDAIGQPAVHPDTNAINVDCGICHNIKTFDLANVFDHAVILSSELACETCHAGATAVALVKTDNHVSTSADCGSCHNTNGFTPAYIDHTSEAVIGNVPGSNPPVPITCASCHNDGVNGTAPGYSPNHMTTAEDCGSCHTPGTFASGVFNHIEAGALIDTNCGRCHNDTIESGVPVNHIPTSDDCSVCHTTDAFAGVAYTHPNIDVDNCALCHNGGISTGKDRYHLPTSENCTLCHRTGYDSFANGAYHIYVDVSANCELCHDRVIQTGKPRNTHIPTQDDCIVCHDVSSAFRPSKFLADVHTNISRDCVECHNGEFTTFNGPVEGKSRNHIASSSLCQTCHTITAFAPVPAVDHEQVFGDCSDCHNGRIAIGKSDQHVLTNGECDACHTSTTNFLNVDLNGNYDHTGILSGCSQCHDGILATGKEDKAVPPPHVDTTKECNVCHTTDAFSPATYDHSDVTNNCTGTGCHGDGATGQPTGHPDTTQVASIGTNCGICHNTRTFSLGNTFNHALIDSTELACTSCHDGANAVARVKVLGHTVTSADCGNCHKTASFTPSFVDHNTLSGACAQSGCHDGSNANIKSMHANHLPTTNDCVDCHTPGTFTSGVFDHSQASTTNDIATCTSCHNNNIDAVVSGLPNNHVPTNAECSICHLDPNYSTFAGAVFNHLDPGTDISSCAVCHDSGIALGKDTNHLPTTLPSTQGKDCSVCHDAANFTDFATGANFHDNATVSVGCDDCHNGVIQTGKPSGTHIPSSGECLECHAIGTPFVQSKFMTAVHNNITQGCGGCHRDVGSRNPAPFVTSNGTVPGKDANTHVPTNRDCDVCHTTANPFTTATFSHEGITGDCVSCHHIDAFAGIGALAMPTDDNHRGVTADCGVCHTSDNNPTTSAPSFTYNVFDHTGNITDCASCHGGNAPTATVAPNDTIHNNTASDCSLCHVPGTFTTAVFNHTGIEDGCATCHGGNVPTATVAPNDQIHNTTAEDCSSCHNTEAFAGAQFNHDGITDRCLRCHGDTAVGKPTLHVPTEDDCGDCHKVTGFLPATFDHAGITEGCVDCHDGVFATGKGDAVNHTVTSQDCGVCHTTDTFTGAGFNHLEANGRPVTVDCARSGCHGDGATGQDAKTNPAHLTTELDCYRCHTTATFAGGSWVHDPNENQCDTCHNGSNATGQPPQSRNGHFITGEQCGACHTTDRWAPANDVYTHNGGSDYPGEHTNSLGCAQCHKDNNASITYGSNNSYDGNDYVGFCASCHYKDYEENGDHRGDRSLNDNKDCSGSNCHSWNGNRNEAGGF